MTAFLPRDGLLAWVGQLLEGRTVVAPVQVAGVTLFRPVRRAQDMALEPPFTDFSPKDWLFPPSETILTVERVNGRQEIVPTTWEQEAVLFGLHPCDAQGVALLDLPFLAEPADGLYAQRRARTALVGMACSKPCPECFCTSLGSGPQDPTGADVFLTGVEGGYRVVARTEKGEELLALAKLSAGEPDPPVVAAPEAMPLEGIVEVAPRAFSAPYWERLADRCIHCNMCAFVCPACYCFDIRDYRLGGRIERVRSWESCQSPGFTRLAGGHNPRAAKGARLRQRFYHKFLYFPRQFGRIGCTGCGRCVRVCPVNIDIREVIREMQHLGGGVGAR